MILDEIVKQKQKEINDQKAPGTSLVKKLAANKLSLIAEIKKASPSKGLIAEDFRPEKQLLEYQAAGVDGISILTDRVFFQGENEILSQLSKKTSLPLLRKDFILDPFQIYESKFLGADVILLIAAILDREQINKLLTLSSDLGLEAIVEVHNRQELNKVLSTPAKIIGINNRDLHDFTVDLKATESIVELLEKKNIRNKYYLISESGISNSQDVNYLAGLNVNGILVGEALMRADNPREKVKELMAVNKQGVAH